MVSHHIATSPTLAGKAPKPKERNFKRKANELTCEICKPCQGGHRNNIINLKTVIEKIIKQLKITCNNIHSVRKNAL